ncbi:MAG: hypothetical protein ABI352_09040 [Candidatus Dormibacter sp.]
MLRWLFRSRRTGKITIVQLPNVPLAVFLVVWVLRRIAHPSGALDTALAVVGTLGLVVWAGDEVLRGVNPFRRLLGAAVLVALAVTFVLQR